MAIETVLGKRAWIYSHNIGKVGESGTGFALETIKDQATGWSSGLVFLPLMARLAGFEPTTSASAGQRSIR